MKFRLFLMDGDWTFPSPLLHLRSRHPGELRQPPAAHPAQQHVSPGARQTHRGAGAVWTARTSAGLHQPASSQWNPSRTRSGGAGNELSARHNETALNETLWCFRVFCWLILLCPNSACQWDDYRQPVCDLGLGQSRPGSRRTGGLRPGRPRLSYICGTSSGPSPSRWPEQLWGRPGPEAEEPGAAEHPPRTGRHGLPQEPGAGPILPAHATQHPTGDGAGWAGGWPAGGHPPTKER